MKFEMQKAIFLAQNIKDFINFIQDQKNKNNFRIDHNKLYQIKLIIEEYKFQIVADELLRINQFDWDQKYTYYLVNQFNQGITIIDEYVKKNHNELFIITARLYTLKNLSSSFSKIA